MTWNGKNWNNATTAVRGGQSADTAYGSIAAPIYQTANFRFDEPGKTRGYDYTRSGNPTRNALEEVLAELEAGAGAVACGTGMGAITTALAHFDGGDHLICSHDCYGGTARLLRLYAAQGKLDVSFVDTGDPDAVAAAIRPATRCLWIETPSNPLLRITDIAALAAITAGREILFVVDNTFLSPLLQKPLTLGADLVVHSTTKYLNGHSDVVGGAIVARDAELAARFAWLANALGTTAPPFDSWLTLRGIKTVDLRIRAHERNAGAVARFLYAHPRSSKVFYPGLPSHDGHALAARQQSGFGGMVSFAFDGTPEELHTFLSSTRLFTLAESLGGVESLIEHPATMSHASMDPDLRRDAGITDAIVRLSVGVEAIDDLIEDLENAFALCGSGEKTIERKRAVASALVTEEG